MPGKEIVLNHDLQQQMCYVIKVLWNAKFINHSSVCPCFQILSNKVLFALYVDYSWWFYFNVFQQMGGRWDMCSSWSLHSIYWQLTTVHCVISQKSTDLICFAVEAWNHEWKVHYRYDGDHIWLSYLLTENTILLMR